SMRRVVSFIAVALATAICLFPQIHSVAGSVVVAVLAIVALILGRLKPEAHQTAALFLIGVAAIDLVTFAAASQVGSNFAQRSAMHVDREIRRVHHEVATIESQLDGSAGRIAAEMAKRPQMNRAELFRLLAPEPTSSGRGMRVVGANGSVMAWWGEELRVTGNINYQFDVTNLYVIRSRPVPNAAAIVQAFERIPNQPREHSLFDPDDDWVFSTIFHGGALRQESGTRRYLIEKRPDASLFIDVVPH